MTFLVTREDSSLFRSTLQAALNQQAITSSDFSQLGLESPDHIHTSDTHSAHPLAHSIVIVDASPTGEVKSFISQHHHDLHYVRTPGAANFAQAMSDAVADIDIQSLLESTDYYWFLHHDSIAHPQALAHQLAVMESGASIAVVGPKHHGPQGEIYEVGITATRSGHRIETALPDELDQGQYDGRSDVLGVGTAGMLVRSALWQEVRGFSRLVSPYNDGLEFCRRIRRAGYRVLVAPRALLTHHRDSLNDSLRAKYALRRSRMNMATLATPWWHMPFYLFFFAFTQPLRAFWAALTLRGTQALAELLAFLAWLVDIPAVLKRKATGRMSARVPRSVLKAVEAPWYEVWQRRTWERKRIESIGGYEASPVLLAAIQHYRRRYWSVLAALSLLTVLYSLVVWGAFLGGANYPQNIVTGSSWEGLPYHWHQVWLAASTPVTGGGGELGPFVPDPLVVLIAALTAPLAMVGLSTSLAMPLLWIAAMPLCALGMWWASGLLTPRLGLRAMSALLWVAQPAFITALSTGQVGSVLFHLTLPAAVAAALRVLGARYDFELAAESSSLTYRREHHRRWWGISALLFSVLVAAVPGSLLAILLAVLTISIALIRRPTWSVDRVQNVPARSRLFSVWMTTIPALILAGPYLFQVVLYQAWPLLLSPAGASLVGRGIFGSDSFTSAGVEPQALALGLPAGHITRAAVASPTVFCLALLAFAWVAVVLLATVRLYQLIALPECQRKGVSAAVMGVGVVATAGAFAAAYLPVQWYFPPWHELFSAQDLAASGINIVGSSLPPLSMDEFFSAHHSVNMTVAPLLSLAAYAFVTSYVMLSPNGRAQHLPRLLSLSTALVVVALAVVSVAVQTPERTLQNLSYGSVYSLPVAVLNAQSAPKGEDTSNVARSVLVVIPNRQGIHTQRLEGNGRLLTESSALVRYLELGTVTQSAVSSIEEAVATLSIAPDEDAVQMLARSGIDSVALLRINTPENEHFADILAQTQGVEVGAQTQVLQIWRIRPSEQNPVTNTDKQSVATAENNTQSVLGDPFIHQIRFAALAVMLLLAVVWSVPLPRRARHAGGITRGGTR